MTDPQADNQPHREPTALRGVALTAASRLWTAALVALSLSGLFAVLVWLTAPSESAARPLQLVRFALAFVVAPAVVVSLLHARASATITVTDGTLIVRRRRVRSEVPLASIRELRPWRIPLPGCGFDLGLASGRRFELGLMVERPSALVELLERSSANVASAPYWTVVHGDATAAVRQRRWFDPLLRYPVFALVPTLPLFRVHQLIAYGGVFGEYQQYGARAYLLGFFVYWATLTVYLMAYRTALRIPAEAVALAAAALRPSAARSVRRNIERGVAVLYYGGVPALLVLRFVPW